MGGESMRLICQVSDMTQRSKSRVCVEIQVSRHRAPSYTLDAFVSLHVWLAHLVRMRDMATFPSAQLHSFITTILTQVL